MDYGYRDSKNFWYTKHRRPIPELLPIRKQTLSSVRYAADRADDVVQFTDDAIKLLVNVPRVFLGLVLKGCVKWAKENNVTLITEKEMNIINEQRKKKKAEMMSKSGWIIWIIIGAILVGLVSFLLYNFKNKK